MTDNCVAVPALREACRYVAVGAEEALFAAAHDARLPVLLKGPTGCGKTRLVEAMAARLERPLVTISCHEDLTASDLVGRFLLQGAETVWSDGPLVSAMRRGAICYLDEVVEARPDTLAVLHGVTDHRRRLAIDRLNCEVIAADGFMLVASYNPAYQSVLKDLKPSLRQRMIAIDLGYPPSEVERQVLCGETGIDAALAAHLVTFAAMVRSRPELGLREVVSTRALVNAALLVQAGTPVHNAVDHAVLQTLTDDPRTAAGLRELASAMFDRTG